MLWRGLEKINSLGSRLASMTEIGPCLPPPFDGTCNSVPQGDDNAICAGEVKGSILLPSQPGYNWTGI